MALTRLLLMLAMSWNLLAGCQRNGPPSARAAEPKGMPQPKLPTTRLYLGAHQVSAEIARTADQKQSGMMYRTNLAEMEGMLFVFDQPHRASFWMKNTLIPLAIAYLDRDGVIREIHEGKPLDESGLAAGRDDIQFVLELPKGWFERNQVKVGALVRTEKGTLWDTFLGKR